MECQGNRWEEALWLRQLWVLLSFIRSLATVLFSNAKVGIVVLIGIFTGLELLGGICNRCSIFSF